MKIDELKAKVESLRDALKGNKGGHVLSSPSGPIGIGIINNIVSAMEALDKRIAALEAKR